MKLKTSIIAVLVTVATCLIGGCSGREQVPPTVAVVLPLSGPYAAVGEEIRKGIELAWDSGVDGEPSRSFEIEFFDSAGHPLKASEVAKGAMDHGAIALVGGVTEAEAMALDEVAGREEVVFLSLSQTAPHDSKYTFRIVPSSRRVATSLARYAVRDLGIDRVTVLEQGAEKRDGAREDSFGPVLESMGGRVVSRVSYGPIVGNPEEILGEALEESSEAIFLSGTVEPVRSILEALAQRRHRGKVLTSSLLATHEGLLPEGRIGFDLLVGRVPFDPSVEDAVVGAFVERFEERYDEKPGLFAAYGHDAMSVLKEAAAETDGDLRRFGLWKGMRGVSEYRGLTGFLQFDERGEVAVYPRVYEIVSSKVDDSRFWRAAG